MSSIHQKIESIGRPAAVFSSILLGALLFNLWVLKATALEPKFKQSEPYPSIYVPEAGKKNWLEKLFENVLQSGTATAAIPAAEISADLAPMNFAKPAAYVHIDKLYLITRSGKIMGAADSCDSFDLPVISNDSFMLDKNGRKLIDAGTRDALRLLGDLESSYVLKNLVSEIKINEKNLIVYMNLGKVIPVMFGQGAWKEKINNFISYQKQLGASELNQKALYLDLRVENRIIVKMDV